MGYLQCCADPLFLSALRTGKRRVAPSWGSCTADCRVLSLADTSWLPTGTCCRLAPPPWLTITQVWNEFYRFLNPRQSMVLFFPCPE